MTAPVFLTEPGDLDQLAPGGTFTLTGAEARHAAVVQRRAVGELVDVVDQCGVRLRGRINAANDHGVELEVLDVVHELRPTPRLGLVQALAKGDRDELAIEAATELGVDRVVPWQAQRSIVVWRGNRAAKSRALWLGTVRAAAKQSRRSWVPPVSPAHDTRDLVELTSTVTGAGGMVLILHESATTGIADVQLSDGAEILVVVGPEGGISDDELTRLTAVGAVTVRLGPHVLRTSTAGPAALAVLAYRLGHWGMQTDAS